MAKKPDPRLPAVHDYVESDNAGRDERDSSADNCAGESSADTRSLTVSVVETTLSVAESTKIILRKAADFNVLSDRVVEKMIYKVEDRSRRRQPIRDRYIRMIEIMNSEGSSYTSASERVAEEVVVMGDDDIDHVVDEKERRRHAVARELRREWINKHPK